MMSAAGRRFLVDGPTLVLLLLPLAQSFAVKPLVVSKQGSRGTMAAAKGVEEKKAIKDLTLVFCRRKRGPNHAARQGDHGDGSGDDGDEILLGMKKRGFGMGKWNGFGGKVEGEETVAQAAKRELMEESGVTAQELSLRGQLIFHVPSYPSTMRVHVYEAVSYQGEPEESEEMRPRWFRETELPLKDMWADDEYWMPLFLKGKSFRGEFHFSDEETIVSHELRDVTLEGIA